MANTAGAIMKGYEQLGPIAGTVAAVLLGATGVVQLGIANKQREAAKGYAVGGFTGDGGTLEPAGIVHKGEWVAPNWMLENPFTADIIRNLESWRQNPVTIRPEAVQLTNSFRPFAEGGYSSARPLLSQIGESPMATTQPDGQTLKDFTDAIKQLLSWQPSVAVETYERKRDKYNEINNSGLK